MIIYAGDTEIGRTDSSTGDSNALSTVTVTSSDQADSPLAGNRTIVQDNHLLWVIQSSVFRVVWVCTRNVIRSHLDRI